MNEKSWITLRIIAGGYLAYLGFNLLKNVIAGKPENSLIFIICGVLFLVIGLGYLVKAIKQYRAYEEPVYEEDEDTENENIESEDAEEDIDEEAEASVEDEETEASVEDEEVKEGE